MFEKKPKKNQNSEHEGKNLMTYNRRVVIDFVSGKTCSKFPRIKKNVN